MSMPAACEFLEEFLVECLAFVERSHRHEDVTADELMDDLAVSAQTLERYLVVAVVSTQFNLQYACVLYRL